MGITGDLTTKVTALALAWKRVADNAALAQQMAMRGRGYTPPAAADTSIAPSQNSGKGGGNNITVNITNPKTESSEESIKKNLRSLSFTGIIAS